MYSYSLTFRTLSHDRSIASSKVSPSPTAMQCAPFKFSASCLLLKVIKWLLTFSSSPSRLFCASPYLPFNNVFQKAVPKQDETNPVSVLSMYCCTFDIPPLLESMRSSLLTWSVQLIISTLLQHHIAKLTRLIHINTFMYSKLCRNSNSLRAGQSGDRIEFSAPVQTGPEAHPASYTMGAGSFPRVQRPGRGVDHPSHLAPRLKKESSYTSAPLWAFVTCSRVNFTLMYINIYVQRCSYNRQWRWLLYSCYLELHLTFEQQRRLPKERSSVKGRKITAVRSIVGRGLATN